MALFARAGQIALASDLINVPLLVSHYYQIAPDLEDPTQKVIFGTSGHRGCATLGSFNEAHLLAIAQAIAEVRKAKGISGPCFIGKDSHALSEPALLSVLEVFVANQIDCCIAEHQELTPTPAVSYAILQRNMTHPQQADGIVLTPSHNPPRDGGIKYNPPNGGPADTDITKEIEARANALLANGLNEVKRANLKSVLASNYLHFHDFMTPYVEDLKAIVDLPLIQKAKLKLAVDPLGGAGVSYWERIAEFYKLDLTVVNKQIDPSFRFMTLDHDGEIRMDCSSPYAMAGLLNLRNQYDLAFANDADHDRHGIVTPEGLMNPNHFLAVSIDYLFKNRPQWSKDVAIGKTLVSSAIIDRVAHRLGRTLIEVPVGFKWFVEGLFNGKLGFVGEESAGASFLRFNGKTWTTDKDGIIMCLLAAEIQAKTHMNPQQYYSSLAEKLGSPSYLRIQEPATFEQKKRLSLLSADNFTQTTLAGDKITQILTKAPGNQAPIGGVKVVTKNGWFTARPSGTENAYKIYCESFLGQDHLQEIASEATKMVNTILQ